MAYLEPELLRCPNCDYTQLIEVVVSEGPHSKPGDIPSRTHQKSETGVDGPEIRCPNDGTVLWTDEAGKLA